MPKQPGSPVPPRNLQKVAEDRESTVSLATRQESRVLALGKLPPAEAQQILQREGEHRLRIGLAVGIFSLVFLWLTTDAVILWCRGPNPLSDAVLIALLSTTTINVIGLLLAVARYLFPNPFGSTPKPPRKPPVKRQTKKTDGERSQPNANFPGE